MTVSNLDNFPLHLSLFHSFHFFGKLLFYNLLWVNLARALVGALCRFQRFHQIYIPIFGMFAGDSRCEQHLCKCSRITSAHGSRVIHFQSPEYVRSRKPFTSFFIVSGHPVAGMKDFFRRTRMIKGGVVALQFYNRTIPVCKYFSIKKDIFSLTEDICFLSPFSLLFIVSLP